MCKFRTLNDAPVTLKDWEKAENVYDYEYNFEKNASEEEVEAMHNHEGQENPMPYRKKKAITKIFRRSSYLPSLEDIEEGEEKPEDVPEAEDYVASSEEEYDMSLSAIHQERAWRYCPRPKFEHHKSRHHRHNHRHHRREKAPEEAHAPKKKGRWKKAEVPGHWESVISKPHRSKQQWRNLYCSIPFRDGIC